MDLKVFVLIYVMFQLLWVNCKKSTTTAKTEPTTEKSKPEREHKKHQKKAKPYNVTNQDPRFENPNYVRDRYKKLVEKPEKNETVLKNHRLPFNPAWMDYCDPYHCNDYHRTVCGLNRNNMKFKWFQSVCHMILNNMCATYRGVLKYDIIENKFCLAYVMFLRSGCEPCTDDVENPICAMSVTDYHTVLFKNKCALKMANCAPATLDEYKQIDMKICTAVHLHAMGIETFHKRPSRIIDALNPFSDKSQADENTIDSFED